jgi:hypothetical protein
MAGWDPRRPSGICVSQRQPWLLPHFRVWCIFLHAGLFSLTLPAGAFFFWASVVSALALATPLLGHSGVILAYALTNRSFLVSNVSSDV